MATLSGRDDSTRLPGQPEDLARILDLSADETEFLRAEHSPGRPLTRLPTRLSPHLVGLMVRLAAENGGKLPVEHPLRRQFVPRAAELVDNNNERSDPLGESLHSPLPRLIHSYRDRALLLVTDQCAVHCRHCFRSRFTGQGDGEIGPSEIDEVCDYLRSHQEIRELILSGGDALMIPDTLLATLLGAVRVARPGMVFRIATRLPTMVPERISQELVELLASFAPLWVVIQVNHSSELGDAAAASLGRMVDAGVPVISQSVLLAGVNDDVSILEDLFTRMVALRVKPYYLFQGDLAPGTAHFRVNLKRAQDIVARLRDRVSGLAMPVFAVDIPGGAGKVRLENSALVGSDARGYQLRAADGSIHHYPSE